MRNIAIIGAGISGLTLAQELSSYAHVTVFEKARGVGGRMSTRYAAPFYFDHGTQYFTARSDEFNHFLKPFIANRTVAAWEGKTIDLDNGNILSERAKREPLWVATPNMNSLCKKLAENITVHCSQEVAPLPKWAANGFTLADKDGRELGRFDWVISTAPAAQTARLFEGHISPASALHNARMQGCYALMIGFNKPSASEWIAAKLENNALDWIAVNSTKPGRDTSVTCWVAHSRNDWADAHMEDNMQAAQGFLLEQFQAATGINAANADFIALHRWKYALLQEGAPQKGFFIDESIGLAATGDWCATSRIEDAWREASLLAQHIISRIANQPGGGNQG
jgi:predicted NAD/FAD-dependent oxidoreductase